MQGPRDARSTRPGALTRALPGATHRGGRSVPLSLYAGRATPSASAPNTPPRARPARAPAHEVTPGPSVVELRPTAELAPDSLASVERLAGPPSSHAAPRAPRLRVALVATLTVLAAVLAFVVRRAPTARGELATGRAHAASAGTAWRPDEPMVEPPSLAAPTTAALTSHEPGSAGPTFDPALDGPVATPSLGSAAGVRADARVRFDGYGSIPGGVLYVPRTFRSVDGAYDLLLHFHGNVKVVVESAEVSGLNALVAVVNLGTGSHPYEALYSQHGQYESLLANIQRVAGERGLASPRLRRLAISTWSGGYGALLPILAFRSGKEPLDALLVSEGIHTGFRPEAPTELNALHLEPFRRYAEKAARGELLFSVTHAEVDPPEFAGARACVDWILARVGGRRVAAYDVLPRLELVEARGAVAKDKEKLLEQTSEARVGLFRVRGFTGNTKEHHMAHLLQIGATLLPELAERWGKVSPLPLRERERVRAVATRGRAVGATPAPQRASN
jgi:hypothetical protein